MESNISIAIKEWLAKQFDTNTNNIDHLLDSQLATTYLLIWPIMEQKLFSGFMKYDKINYAAKQYAPYYNYMNIDALIRYFHNRYQNKTYYKHLKHSRNNDPMDKIVTQPFNTLTNEDKLSLMFFVVYRYRNNIFHGSKGITSWEQYSPQIDKCLQFMMCIVDCYEKNIR